METTVLGLNTIYADKRGKGSGYEALLNAAMHFYETHGIAAFRKFGAEAAWGKDNQVFAEPGKVDYIGVVRVPGVPWPIPAATDAKSTEMDYLDVSPGRKKGQRWVGRKVPVHQIEFLSWFDQMGGLAFWTVQFTSHRRHFVLPHAVFLKHYAPPWRIPLHVFEQEGIEVFSTLLNPLDFLAAVPKLMAMKQADPRWQKQLPEFWTKHFRSAAH